MDSPVYQSIYEAVRHVPRGRVATYGQVARVAGRPATARQVGYALSRLPEGTDVPWHRVVNAKGEVSALPFFGGAEIQRAKLESEGVRFDASDRIDFSRYRWELHAEPDDLIPRARRR